MKQNHQESTDCSAYQSNNVVEKKRTDEPYKTADYSYHFFQIW